MFLCSDGARGGGAATARARSGGEQGGQRRQHTTHRCLPKGTCGQCVNVLLNAEANLEAANSLGFTALAVACARSDTATAQSLRDAGATTDVATLQPPATCAMLTFCTAGFPDVVTQRGRVYYEIVLVCVGPSPQIGWATAGFSCRGGRGVGDDGCSWGADGARGKLWHRRDQKWSVRWADGDVVSCAADLDQGNLWFGRNGEWTMAFEECSTQWTAGLFPAMSGKDMAFAACETPRFAGPSPDFRSIEVGKHPQLLSDQKSAIYVTV